MHLRYPILFSLWVLLPLPAMAASDQASTSGTEAFDQCLIRLKAQAANEGISNTGIEQTFGQIEQLPRVIASDRAQPEFTQSFSDYYKIRVSNRRVTTGREKRIEFQDILQTLAKESSVPTQYLLAFWGLETNYGSYFGKLHIPSALATLACDPRRAEFFTAQLMATAKIVDAGHMQPQQLVGSWAGAMGHMQFMPTTYLEYAKDANNDGRADLHGSVADAMYSASDYLTGIGWLPGFRWGREVLLPDEFNYELTGSDNWQPLKTWAELGVTDTAGNVMPSLDLDSAVLVPSGRHGPAFIVYPNFKVIMKWNRSEFYALSVGRLADRIAGAGGLHIPLPDSKIPTEKLIALQDRLNQSGYNLGKADGILGPATRRAIQSFQKSKGLIADGFPDGATFKLIDDLEITN
ncbi:MAG: lytic murein transglycosylase [Pseudomonadota bacterium]